MKTDVQNWNSETETKSSSTHTAEKLIGTDRKQQTTKHESPEFMFKGHLNLFISLNLN
jgi:hypothetical protein